jgi:hypothetical protein
MRVVAGMLLLICLLVVSCRKKIDDNQPIGKMRYFEFTMRYGLDGSYNFYAAASDADLLVAIDQELAIPFEDRTHHINGMVDSGNGGYNKNFEWHYIPDQWGLAQVSIELCDGYPADPKERAPYNFCPWLSKLLKEVNSESLILK